MAFDFVNSLTMSSQSSHTMIKYLFSQSKIPPNSLRNVHCGFKRLVGVTDWLIIYYATQFSQPKRGNCQDESKLKLESFIAMK